MKENDYLEKANFRTLIEADGKDRIQDRLNIIGVFLRTEEHITLEEMIHLLRETGWSTWVLPRKSSLRGSRSAMNTGILGNIMITLSAPNAEKSSNLPTKPWKHCRSRLRRDPDFICFSTGWIFMVSVLDVFLKGAH